MKIQSHCADWVWRRLRLTTAFCSFFVVFQWSSENVVKFPDDLLRDQSIRYCIPPSRDINNQHIFGTASELRLMTAWNSASPRYQRRAAKRPGG